MDIKFFLTIKIPQHARIAIDFSKRQNQYGNYKASHTTGNTSQPSTHVLPSFRKVFCGHFHSDWKHSHTNYNLLVWGPGCCFLQDLTLGKFPMLRLRYGTTYSWVLCSWFGGGTPMFFARWRLEPIVAVVVVVVAVQVRNPRRADAVARCLRINIYIYMKYTAAFALGTSLPARIVNHKLPHLSLAKHKAGKANGFQRWVHTPDS